MLKRAIGMCFRLVVSGLFDFHPLQRAIPALAVVLSFAVVVVSMYSGNIFAEDLVFGVSAKWVRGVEKRVPGKIHDGSTPSAPLYFWMRYEGNRTALKYIRENGGLPSRHKWSVSVGGIVAPEAPDRAETDKEVPSSVGPDRKTVYTERTTIPLSIGTNKQITLAAFQSELINVEAFNWRTWSMKRNVSKGLWKVEVVYENDGRPVNCKEEDQTMHPCIYTIRVK